MSSSLLYNIPINRQDMNINSDISQRVVIEQSTLPWVASPLVGVLLRPMEGGADTAARATAIIKLVPGTKIVS